MAAKIGPEMRLFRQRKHCIDFIPEFDITEVGMIIGIIF